MNFAVEMGNRKAAGGGAYWDRLQRLLGGVGKRAAGVPRGVARGMARGGS